MQMSSTHSENFTKRLRVARELRKLNQAELAERAGFQPAAISHFETGVRKPSFDNLRRLADALEVTTDFLLGRSDDPATSGANVDPLYRNFERLSSRDRDLARNFMATLARQTKESGPKGK